MEYWLLLVGLALGLVGALLSAIGDAWLSRSILVYLDAVEANVAKVVQALQTAGAQPDVTGINLKRDLGQDRARTLKTVGGLTLAVGFGLQLASVWLLKHKP